MPRLCAFALPCVLVSLLVTLAACGTPARRGVALSDVQREAAKDEDEKTKVIVADEPEEPVEEEEPGAVEVTVGLLDALTTAAEPQPVTSLEEEPAPLDHNNFSVVGTGLSFGGNVLRSQAGAGLLLGYYPGPKLKVALGGYYLDGALGSQGEGFADFQEWTGEAIGRFYLTSDHTLVGLYAQLGGRLGWFTWDYANPVTVTDGDGQETIESDALTTYSLFVGLGISPLQLSRFHLGTGVNVGFRSYQTVTREGFDNDLFPTVGFTQFFVEATTLF